MTHRLTPYRLPDTQLHMGIINRVMEDIYNEFSKNTEDGDDLWKTGRFEHMQTLSRLQGDSDESDSEVYEIYPSAMNNADLYDVSHESDDSFESNSDRIFASTGGTAIKSGAGSIILITLTAFVAMLPR